MPSRDDWIEYPLNVMNNIHDNNPKGDVKKNVETYFHEKLDKQETRNSIPSLNDVAMHGLKGNCLVRFRCMVQDMYDPEYYLGAYAVRDLKTGQTSVRSGMYQDIAHCRAHEEILMDDPQSRTMDRQTLYCVPLPGESAWAKQHFASEGQSQEIPSGTTRSQGPKRSHDDDDMNETTPNNITDINSKPAANGHQGDTGGDPHGEEAMETASRDTDHKKIKTDTSGDKKKATERPDLNFPLVGEKGPACLVKIYSSEVNYKVNDMVEFIGVLSNDPTMAEFPAQEQETKSAFVNPADMQMDVAEQQVRCPPPSLVPRLHVVKATLLAHSNPLLPVTVDVSSKEVQEVLSHAAETRTMVMELLEKLLFGDNLAAEFLLCQLVSNVHTRQDIVALGKFGLNLSGCPRDTRAFVPMFTEVLTSLLAKSYVLPLTVKNLNECKFTPRKDYNLNRLTSGLLQLSDNTHLILDETAMEPGQLDARGVKNLTAIGNVISWQKCEYDFNFHKQDFRTNINVLVMSEGKSLIKVELQVRGNFELSFQCDCQCPLAAEPISEQQLQEQATQLRAHLSAQVLTRMRTYLGLVQQLPYEPLPEDLQQEIENTFVECRKTNKKDMTVDDLHMLLTLARLVSLSHGKTTLTREIWEKTQQMEYARKQRFTNTAQTA